MLAYKDIFVMYGGFLAIHNFMQLSMHFICYYEVIIIITFICTLVPLIGLFRYDELVYLFWLTFMTLLWLWLCFFVKHIWWSVQFYCSVCIGTSLLGSKIFLHVGSHLIQYTGLDFYCITLVGMAAFAAVAAAA